MVRRDPRLLHWNSQNLHLIAFQHVVCWIALFLFDLRFVLFIFKPTHLTSVSFFFLIVDTITRCPSFSPLFALLHPTPASLSRPPCCCLCPWATCIRFGLNSSEWIAKLWDLYTTWLRERTSHPSRQRAWMDLEIIMLSEISQSEKDKYHMISLYVESNEQN